MTTPVPSAYRPAIDGLRAVAIVAVLVFHLFPEWLPGGYLGVDVFFVISGYLITSILLREMAAGEFGIGRFWSRRIRRIVPALLVVTAATLMVARIEIFPQAWPWLAQQALATLGLFANVHLWRATGNYWGEQAEQTPLLHMWSLAVEEQFYLVFPVFLHVIWRRARPAVLPLLVMLAVGSYVVFVIGLYRAPAATFYLLPGRAWELAVGACMGALARKHRCGDDSRRMPDALACAALAAIVTSFFLLPRLSAWAAVPVVASAVVIAGSRNSVCHRLLSLQAIVWIGRLSYSLYLWHWPVRVLLPQIAPDISKLAVVLVTVCCSGLSYAFVEEPARRRPSILPAIGAGFVMVAGIALWMLYEPAARYDVTAFDKLHSSIRMYDVRPQPRPPTATFRRVFADVDAPWTLATPESYANDGIVVGKGGEPPAIVVFGDSHASMFAETLRTVAEQLGRRIAFFSMNGAASPFIDIPVRRGPPNTMLSSEQKYRFDAARLRAIEKWRPRVVVVCARWSLYGDPGTACLEYLGQRGVAVLLVEQPPELAAVGDNSVVQFLCWKGVSPAPGIEHWLPQGNVPQVEAGRNRLREIASRHPHCRILPTADLYARGEQALVLDGRKVLYLDDDHLTSAGAQLAMPRIAATLAELLE